MIPLPSKLKNRIRNHLRYRLFGERRSIDEVFAVDHTYDLIKRSKIVISAAVNIGANKGQWALRFSRHFPRARLLSIEANPINLEDLRRVNPDSMQACLAETAGQDRIFYLPNSAVESDNMGASLYRELLPGYRALVCLQLQYIHTGLIKS